MPRKPVVSHEDLKTAIFKTDGIIDLEGNISDPRHNCWQLVSKLFNGKISAKYVYQYVHKNRYNSCVELKNLKGINSLKKIENCNNTEDCYSDTDDTEDQEILSNHSDIHVFPKKTFRIVIPKTIWLTMKPFKKKYTRNDRLCMKTRDILPPFVWEPFLIDILWDQHQIPCPYTFDSSYIYKQSEESGEYLCIKGHCKECNGTGIGKIIPKPNEGEDVPMTWRATDSRKIKHTKKRPLMGVKKNRVATELTNKSTSIYRRIQAKNTMDQGDQEPPNLHSMSVLRKTKQEKEQADNSSFPHGVDDVTAVLVMKHRQPYAGSIHDIGVDKFFIHYHTPAQILVYMAYSKKSYSVLNIDATGGLVRKIPRINGLSGHIFLYEGVVNTGNVQMPVMQMLSEKHDSNSILYWLNEFIRNGGLTPKEVIVDNSGALINAIARSFCRCVDTNDYVDKCFTALLGQNTFLPSCYLRLDVAHFLSAAGKWNVWHETSMSRLKDFYLRCLGILVQCDSLFAFEILLKHVLIVSLSPNEGKDNFNEDVPMEKSFHFLKAQIKNFRILTLPEQEETTNEEEADILTSDSQEDDNITSVKNKSNITKWLNDIEKSVEGSIKVLPHGRLNPYYSPMVAKEFFRVVDKFVLWSAVMVHLFGSPYLTASSTSVESDFSDLKKNILKGVNKPLSIPKFLSLHIDAIEGSCRIAGAAANDENKKETVGENRLNRISTARDVCKTELIFNNLNEVENWRGLGEERGKRQSTCLNTLPEFDAAVQANLLKQQKRNMLKNGNLCRSIKMGRDNSLLIRNTCAFDALAQVICSGYIMYDRYRYFADSSTNLLMRTAKSLATAGAIKETYHLRALAITAVMQTKCSLIMPQSLPKKNSGQTTIKDYDCTTNAPNLSRMLMTDIPSLTVKTLCCTGEKCTLPDSLISVLDTNMNILLDNGLHFLDQAIMSPLKIQSLEYSGNEIGELSQLKLLTCKPPCKGMPTVNIDMGEHILIDIDYLSDTSVTKIHNLETSFNRLHALKDFPVSLNLFECKFILVGVIAYIPGHYVAYTRNVNGSWKLYNDLAKTVVNVESEKTVAPHLLFYVKIVVQ